MTRFRGRQRSPSQLVPVDEPATEVVAAAPEVSALPSATTTPPLIVSGIDDLIPTGRVVKGSSRPPMRIVAAGVAAVLVLVAVLAVWALAGDDSGSSPSSRSAARRTTEATRTTTTTRVTTTTTAPVATSASTAAPQVGPATTQTDPSGTAAPVPVPLQLAVTPGSCRFDAANELILAAGTMRNPGTVEVSAEIELTWTDATGDLGSETYLDNVAPGATVPWEVSTDAVDPPQGLACRVAQI